MMPDKLAVCHELQRCRIPRGSPAVGMDDVDPFFLHECPHAQHGVHITKAESLLDAVETKRKKLVFRPNLVQIGGVAGTEQVDPVLGRVQIIDQMDQALLRAAFLVRMGHEQDVRSAPVHSHSPA
ncbi:hypothetical protein D9M72_603850 [compost metagenome]